MLRRCERMLTCRFHRLQSQVGQVDATCENVRSSFRLAKKKRSTTRTHRTNPSLLFPSGNWKCSYPYSTVMRVGCTHYCRLDSSEDWVFSVYSVRCILIVCSRRVVEGAAIPNWRNNNTTSIRVKVSKCCMFRETEKPVQSCQYERKQCKAPKIRWLNL